MTLLPLISVLAVALVVRLWYLWSYSKLPDWELLGVDNYYYHNWATSIASGNILGDTTYFRAPFYAYCLGFLYALFGTSLWTARLFGVSIGVASVLMTFLIGRRLFNARIGLTASAIQTVYPIVVYYGTELLADALFTLLVQLSIHYLLTLSERPDRRHLFTAGAMIGLAMITRPVALFLIPMGLVLILRHAGIGTVFVRFVVMFSLGVLSFVGPVAIRNALLAHDPVLIASQGGINWYIGNHAGADGVAASLPEPLGYNWTQSDVRSEAERSLGRGLSSGEISTYWFELGNRWIVEHPSDFLRLFLRKLYYSVAPMELFNDRDLGLFFAKIPLLHRNPLTFPLLLTLALAGIILVAARSSQARWLLACMVVYLILTSLFFVNSRFRLPIIPYFFVFASCTLLSLVEQIRVDRKRAVLTLFLMLTLAPICYHAWILPKREPTAQTQSSLALFHYSRGEFREALQVGRSALEDVPTFPDLNLNVGACYLRLGEIDSAMVYFQREKALHPGRSRAYTNIATIRQIQNSDSLARVEINHALGLRPQDPIANRIWLRLLASDSSITAAALYDSVLAASKQTDGNLTVLNEAIELMLNRNDLDWAQQLLSRAIAASAPPVETDDGTSERLFPNGPEGFSRVKAKTYYLAGTVSGLSGRAADAISYSQQSIVLSPEQAESYLTLIGAYRASGNEAAADSVLASALARFPSHAEFSQLAARRRRLP